MKHCGASKFLLRALSVVVLFYSVLACTLSFGDDQLIEADSMGKDLIERIFYSPDGPSDLLDAGVFVNSRAEPDYVEIIRQFNEVKKQYGRAYLKRELIRIFAYDATKTLMYIFDNYDEWAKLKHLNLKK